MKYIPVNIWDDYAEDGYGYQETKIYIESKDFTDMEFYILYYLNSVIDNYKLPKESFTIELYDPKILYPNWEVTGTDSDFWNSYWILKTVNLTHKRREYLVNKLNELDLEFNNIKLKIYSES